jgi:hypothetical protein
MSSSSRVFNKIRSGSKSSLFIEGLIKAADHGEPKRFSTIGSMQSAHIGLVRNCMSCGHKSAVDIDAEIKAHGEEAALTEIGGACESCGAKPVSVLPA